MPEGEFYSSPLFLGVFWLKKEDEEIKLLLREHAEQLRQIAREIAQLREMVSVASTREHVISAQPDNDYTVTGIRPLTMYVDNTGGLETVYVTLDGRPFRFIVPAGAGKFFPCAGVRSFRVEGGPATVWLVNQLFPFTG